MQQGGPIDHGERFWGTPRRNCARFLLETSAFSKRPLDRVGTLWFFVRLYRASRR